MKTGRFAHKVTKETKVRKGGRSVSHRAGVCRAEGGGFILRQGFGGQGGLKDEIRVPRETVK